MEDTQWILRLVCREVCNCTEFAFMLHRLLVYTDFCDIAVTGVVAQYLNNFIRHCTSCLGDKVHI